MVQCKLMISTSLFLTILGLYLDWSIAFIWLGHYVMLWIGLWTQYPFGSRKGGRDHSTHALQHDRPRLGSTHSIRRSWTSYCNFFCVVKIILLCRWFCLQKQAVFMDTPMTLFIWTFSDMVEYMPIVMGACIWVVYFPLHSEWLRCFTSGELLSNDDVT